MRKLLIYALCLTALLAQAPPARTDTGRDILFVTRSINNWTREDTVLILEADGTITQFELKGTAQLEIKSLEELLFFLRYHGLSNTTMLYDAPPPEKLNPVSQDIADQVRQMAAQVIPDEFERTFHAFDAGALLTYAVIRVNGEAQLTLLSEDGTFQGQTSDAAGIELMHFIGPYMMRE